MKVWKLVSGILSIVISAFVLFQSSMAGLSNAMQANEEVSGTAGLMVAIFLLTGGIVSIATRKGGKGGSIAVLILYALPALIGFTMAGSYSDLKIWAGWCLICAVLALISLFTKKKNKEESAA